MSLNEEEQFCQSLEVSLGALGDIVAEHFVEQCWAHWRL